MAHPIKPRKETSIRILRVRVGVRIKVRVVRPFAATFLRVLVGE